MADTKKEHYVPQCYLENFTSNGILIEVFDKWKLQARNNQNIRDVAMENFFYDLDLLGLMDKKLEDDKKDKMRTDLLKIVGTDKWEDVEAIIGNKKYIEKEHFIGIEGAYSRVLKSIIQKSYGGSKWVIENCRAMAEYEKTLMSFFIATQVIRTKKFRETLGDIVEGAIQTLAYKSQMHEKDAKPKEAFQVKADKDFIKLQHSMMILQPEPILQLAEILESHVWIMCVNKTQMPFYTSDEPVVKIAHKKDKFISHSGFASEGIEIAFPLSPYLLLCMFDKKEYGGLFNDRQFYEMYDLEEVKYYNKHQILHSYRCVYSVSQDFSLAEKFCKDNPELQEYHSDIEVL